MDLKEAARAAAARTAKAKMPFGQAERVVEGARHLSPYLGMRMRAAKLMHKSIFIRELLPQDLKIEIERLPEEEALEVAHDLAAIVGKARRRQMDAALRKQWQADLCRNRTKSLDAPNSLSSSVVALLAERVYLEHCRKYAREDS